MNTFNLVTSEWIPVTGKENNEISKIGICSLLKNANDYKNIQGTTPLETSAIYRLLIAFIHSAYLEQYKSQDFLEPLLWNNYWQQQSFDKNVISKYCDKYNPHFYLFDSSHPFYQDVKLSGDIESVSSLIAHISSGDDPTLFNHNVRTDPIKLSIDRAARALITIQSFGLAGTKGPHATFSDAPFARGISFFILGDTLFETLMLNLIELDLPGHRLKYSSKDQPTWLQPDPFLEDPRRPFGLLDYLTWQNRRIKLIEPDDKGEVVSMIYRPGLKTSDTKTKSVRDVFNPFYNWTAKDSEKPKRKNERSHSPILFKQDKTLWRDSAALFELSEDEDNHNKQPAPLLRVRELAAQGIIPYNKVYSILAIGTCTELGRDKTYFYRSENIPLPLQYFNAKQTWLIENLSTSINHAEKINILLNRSTFLLAWLIGKPLTKEEEFNETVKPFDEQIRIDNKIASVKNEKGKDHSSQQIYKLFLSFGTERLYWSNLEIYFYRLIQDLPKEPVKALENWRKNLKRVAHDAFNHAVVCAGRDIRAQRAIAAASTQFEFGMSELLNVK